MSFTARFNEPPKFTVKFNAPTNIPAQFGSFVEVPVTDYYDGEYSVTPSAQEQTIPIMGLTARHNITVAAIPSNYGLITRVGAILTVS